MKLFPVDSREGSKKPDRLELKFQTFLFRAVEMAKSIGIKKIRINTLWLQCSYKINGRKPGKQAYRFKN